MMASGGAARWRVGLVALLACLLFGLSDGVYEAYSILCDDVASICSENGYRDNVTECQSGEQKFLNPEVCNCGLRCIKNLEEGDSCVTSSIISYPTKLCGPGLNCVVQDLTDQTSSVCIRDPAKKCVNESLIYEEEQKLGILGPGRNKPNCDDYGSYAPRQCSPSSTCYCVKDDGERIFGEESFTQKDTINCKCSVYWEDTLSMGMNNGMRCLPNGNFDPLQCIDVYCFCYNDTTSSITYGPVHIDMIKFIPCYDSNIHSESYINPCHHAQKVWDSQGSSEDIIVADVPRPVCSPDGYYAPVQYLGGNAYCADMYGNRIDDYELPIHKAQDMTCNCPRRRQVMEENGYGASKPKCCPDGRYYPWQTRGPHSYCVDENGNQYGTTATITNMEALQCYTDKPCE